MMSTLKSGCVSDEAGLRIQSVMPMKCSKTESFPISAPEIASAESGTQSKTHMVAAPRVKWADEEPGASATPPSVVMSRPVSTVLPPKRPAPSHAFKTTSVVVTTSNNNCTVSTPSPSSPSSSRLSSESNLPTGRAPSPLEPLPTARPPTPTSPTCKTPSSPRKKPSLLDPIEAHHAERQFDTVVHLDGRTYVYDEKIKYILPTDDQECDRQHRQHYLFRYIWQKNFSAPVEDVLAVDARVLDVGCGSGSWVTDCATSYPMSTFIGVDIAPMFPDEKVKPSNAGFLQCNVVDGLPFPNATFDFVRQGFMMIAIPEHDWHEKVLPEMIRVTKPGGYIELMESDLKYLNAGPIGQRLSDVFIRFAEPIDIHETAHDRIPQWFEQSGQLVDIDDEDRVHSLGPQNGRVGQLCLKDHLSSYESLKPVLRPALECTDGEYDELMQDFARECNQYKTGMKVWRIWARKASTQF